MDKLIVYVNDADHAMRVVQPLLAQPASMPRQWILVACAPRVTHHVSKWVTHSARENWRHKWTDKLFAQIVPWLESQGQEVLTCVGKSHLEAQTDALLLTHGAARVIDARRPKLGGGLQGQPVPRPGLLSACLALLGPGLLALD